MKEREREREREGERMAGIQVTLEIGRQNAAGINQSTWFSIFILSLFAEKILPNQDEADSNQSSCFCVTESSDQDWLGEPRQQSLFMEALSADKILMSQWSGWVVQLLQTASPDDDSETARRPDNLLPGLFWCPDQVGKSRTESPDKIGETETTYEDVGKSSGTWDIKERNDSVKFGMNRFLLDTFLQQTKD